MKDRVFKYLESQFKPLVYISNISLFDKNTGQVVTPVYVEDDLFSVFGSDYDELAEIFDEWFIEKKIEINNAISDIAYELLEHSHYTDVSTLIVNDIAKIIEMLPDKFYTFHDHDKKIITHLRGIL